MRGLGCLLFFSLGVLFAAVEWFVFGHVVAALDGEVFGCLLVMICLSVGGINLLRWRLRRLAPTIMQGGDFGAQAVVVFGAFLLTLPGFASGLVGALLQIPLAGRLFRRGAGTILAAILRQGLARMGSMPGGGMPRSGPFGGAGAGFPFPGGMPGGRPDLRPDQRLKKGRTIDVEKE